MKKENLAAAARRVLAQKKAADEHAADLSMIEDVAGFEPIDYPPQPVISKRDFPKKIKRLRAV